MPRRAWLIVALVFALALYLAGTVLSSLRLLRD